MPLCASVRYNRAMQEGGYMQNRILPEAIRAACTLQNLDCESFSDDWVHCIRKNSKMSWICGYRFDLNSSAASEIARDKVATYAVLHQAGIPALPHALVRAVQTQSVRMHVLREFAASGLVVKPLMGATGHGVRCFTTPVQAAEYIQHSLESAWAVSPYVPIVSETRLVVLDGSLLLAYEKEDPPLRHGLPLYNLSQGARAVEVDLHGIAASLRTIAQASCRAAGLRLGAVDIIRLADGAELVLELNDGFSLEHFSRQSPEYKQRAFETYAAIVRHMF